MHLLVGLGNPGSEYLGTRHNVGFEVIDEVARSLKIRLREGDGEYLIALASSGENEFFLAKPLTYMNNSGEAVAELLTVSNASIDDLLIVCDDFQLPLGTLRMRSGGSDGGHNGLFSVADQLQSETFPRLRCGIGSKLMPADKSAMAAFVLDRFHDKELPALREMVERGAKGCLSFVTDGIAKTMSLYNQRPAN